MNASMRRADKYKNMSLPEENTAKTIIHRPITTRKCSRTPSQSPSSQTTQYYKKHINSLVFLQYCYKKCNFATHLKQQQIKCYE